MLKIGEFSKLSQTTIKALRFYETERLLIPAMVDEWTGYRYYETSQLETMAKIKSYRQMGLTIEEIKQIFDGMDEKTVLSVKRQELQDQKQEIETKLSVINYLLEATKMKYQVTVKDLPETQYRVIVKELPEMIIYTWETVLKHDSDKMEWIPSVGEECLKLNPNLKCTEPPYEFCEYLDGEYRETDVKIRHSEAVTEFGQGNEHIEFKTLPACKVLSVYHKGSYDRIGEAYAFIMDYAEKNGYKVAGRARESYIDGIWNKETVDEWLTEVQLPIE